MQKEALQERFLGRRLSAPWSRPRSGGNPELATRWWLEKLARQARAERKRSTKTKIPQALGESRRDISRKIWSAGSWVGALSLLIGCRIGAPSRVDASPTGLPSRRNLRKGSVVGSSLTSTLGVTQDQEQSECPERGPRGQERALAKVAQGKRTRNPGQQSSRFSGRRPLLLARFFWVGALCE